MKVNRSCTIFVAAAGALLILASARPTLAQRPEYEPAYVDGKTVTINAIEFKHQNSPLQAQADLYLVVYPWEVLGWEALGIAPPQCSPCDHGGDGVTFDDFHDHVLDSIPSNPGHGEYRPLWHVFAVIPAYTGDALHDLLVELAYVTHLPAKSEAAVDALLADTLPDGSPVAIEIDTEFYFLCSVVNDHAATGH
jgi:hypothetical protein